LRLAHPLWNEHVLPITKARGKALRKPAGALPETIPMPNLDNQTIQLIFIAVTALAVLMQAIILLAIFVAVRKAARSITEQVEDLRASVMPILDTTRNLINRVAPKIEDATADLAEITHGLRAQTAQMESAATEIVDRVRRQTNRLDKMFTGVLDSVDKAGAFVADAVSKPVRQISGLLASLKAIVESLRTSAAAPAVPHETHSHREYSQSDRTRSDTDMFV
jgi:methyl-accepting chemotaxis protein